MGLRSGLQEGHSILSTPKFWRQCPKCSVRRGVLLWIQLGPRLWRYGMIVESPFSIYLQWLFLQWWLALFFQWGRCHRTPSYRLRHSITFRHLVLKISLQKECSCHLEHCKKWFQNSKRFLHFVSKYLDSCISTQLNKDRSSERMNMIIDRIQIDVWWLTPMACLGRTDPQQWKRLEQEPPEPGCWWWRWR